MHLELFGTRPQLVRQGHRLSDAGQARLDLPPPAQAEPEHPLRGALGRAGAGPAGHVEGLGGHGSGGWSILIDQLRIVARLASAWARGARASAGSRFTDAESAARESVSVPRLMR